MKSSIAILLLSAAIATPAFGGGPSSATGLIGPVLTTGSVSVVQAANTLRSETAPSVEQPTRNCCYDPVILEREAPAPQANRGSDCCWDASNWD